MRLESLFRFIFLQTGRDSFVGVSLPAVEKCGRFLDQALVSFFGRRSRVQRTRKNLLINADVWAMINENFSYIYLYVRPTVSMSRFFKGTHLSAKNKDDVINPQLHWVDSWSNSFLF